MTQRYDTYKDSGVQWLGEIPGHWKTLLNGILFIEDVRKPETDDIPLSLSQVDGVIPTDEMKESSLKTSSYDNWKRVIVNDLVLNRFKAHLGVMFASNYVGMVSFHYGVFKAKMDLVPKYYEYLYHTNIYRFIYADASKGMTVGLQNLSNTSFYNVRAIYPPKDEQHSIVSFLDAKCGKIDEWVNKKQKEVEHLQELKQRVIADAVTRGLNPHVKMKATNIPWLKEIPEHWEMRKMKYLFDERSEKNHPDEPMLSATQSEGVILQSKYQGRVVVVNTGFEGLKLVKVGDFVIHLRSFQGGIEYAHYRGIISSAYTILNPKYPEYSAYYKRLFKSSSFIDLLKICVTGIREGQNINYSKLKQFSIPVPPLSEQKQIVSYLDAKCAKIDKLITNITKEIECIKEYKQRLISDVVTGQIKVC